VNSHIQDASVLALISAAVHTPGVWLSRHLAVCENCNMESKWALVNVMWVVFKRRLGWCALFQVSGCGRVTGYGWQVFGSKHMCGTYMAAGG
jgi:hypothetical protein